MSESKESKKLSAGVDKWLRALRPSQRPGAEPSKMGWQVLRSWAEGIYITGPCQLCGSPGSKRESDSPVGRFVTNAGGIGRSPTLVYWRGMTSFPQSSNKISQVGRRCDTNWIHSSGHECVK
jgi:hypothetical protein